MQLVNCPCPLKQRPLSGVYTGGLRDWVSDIWVDKPGVEIPPFRRGLTNREGNMTKCDNVVLH